jgi:hypothetical protein
MIGADLAMEEGGENRGPTTSLVLDVAENFPLCPFFRRWRI